MFGFGLTVSLIGMGIVFVELVFLIFVIKLITIVSGAIAGKTAVTGKKPEATVQAAAPAIVETTGDDEDIVAVIAAAVACMTQSGSVVTAIKRIHGVSGSVWSQAGRLDVMSARQ